MSTYLASQYVGSSKNTAFFEVAEFILHTKFCRQPKKFCNGIEKKSLILFLVFQKT